MLFALCLCTHVERSKVTEAHTLRVECQFHQAVTGCCQKRNAPEAGENIVVTKDAGTAMKEMLLHTDETLRIRVDDAAMPEQWLSEALDSSVLARTMLRSVSWSQSGDILTVSAQYAKPRDMLLMEKQMLADAAQTWYNETAAEPQAVRTLLAHDLLCRSCQYCDDTPDCHGAAGALLYRSASCDGYAEAFALLMETAGIPVRIVTGIASETDGIPESHAWNLVQLSGVWYHVDCTWDDIDAAPEHTYFLCNDDTMRLTHTWDAKKYPPAQGGGYRYELIASEMTARVKKGGV